MSIRTYNFDYDRCEADVSFKVDTEVFTNESAKEFLEFFRWDDEPDMVEDLIDEAMKKIALRAIIEGCTGRWNTLGIIDQLEELEGYPSVDGSQGITIIQITNYEFRADNMDMTRTGH